MGSVVGEDGRVYEEHEVGPQHRGWRLDRFLAERLRRGTRSQAQRIIAAGSTTVDGKRGRPALKVQPGQRVRVRRVERPDPLAAQRAEIRVLAEHSDWLVLDKPAGLLVHRTAHELTQTVAFWLGRAFPEERIEPVHRLDRDTSGVLVCGRGVEAVRELRQAFADSAAEKTYLTWVRDPEGHWSTGQQRVFDTPLGFDASSAVELRVGAGEWPCRTWVEAREGREGLRCLRVRIEQGRQHQIRAHLALFGTPVLGDKLYEMGDAFFLDWLQRPGNSELVERLATPWHCLHAHRVRLRTPRFEIEVEAAPPAHFPSSG